MVSRYRTGLLLSSWPRWTELMVSRYRWRVFDLQLSDNWSGAESATVGGRRSGGRTS